MSLVEWPCYFTFQLADLLGFLLTFFCRDTGIRTQFARRDRAASFASGPYLESMAVCTGLEPVTFAVTGRHCNQLY